MGRPTLFGLIGGPMAGVDGSWIQLERLHINPEHIVAVNLDARLVDSSHWGQDADHGPKAEQQEDRFGVELLLNVDPDLASWFGGTKHHGLVLVRLAHGSVGASNVQNFFSGEAPVVS